MRKFAITDAAGRVVAVVKTPGTDHEGIEVDPDIEIAPGRHIVSGGAVLVAPLAPTPPDFAELRRDAYPPVGDQLDAIWKIVAAVLAGENPPADALAIRDAVSAVKARLPKNN